jgi:hypothetical protein
MHAIYNLQNTITHSILGLKILFFESLNSFHSFTSTKNSIKVFWVRNYLIVAYSRNFAL